MEFIYKGQVSAAPVDIPGLLEAADMLQLVSLARICTDILGNSLHPSNCVGVWKLSKYKYKVTIASTPFS